MFNFYKDSGRIGYKKYERKTAIVHNVQLLLCNVCLIFPIILNKNQNTFLQSTSILGII